MMTNREQILVANLKCNGCAITIKNELMKIAGVESVEVDPQKDLVSVVFDDQLNRKLITKALYTLGYPEATEENGLLLRLQSYASCMRGRVRRSSYELVS